QNRQMSQVHLDIQASLSKTEEETLFDPQTSGGLLLSVPAADAEKLVTALAAAGVSSAVRVGEVSEGEPGVVVV
ncbi:MAG: AIR synthase-related protein, partial [Desulfobacterales bacterium]